MRTLAIPISLRHALLALSGKGIIHCSPLVQQLRKRVYICLMNAALAIITQIYRRLNHWAKQKAIMSSDTEEQSRSQNVNADGSLFSCTDSEGSYSSTPVKAVKHSGITQTSNLHLHTHLSLLGLLQFLAAAHN